MLPKKLKDATLEDVRNELPEVFASIEKLGFDSRNEEVAGLKNSVTEKDALIKKEQEKQEVLSFASKLGNTELATKLLADGKSKVEAIEAIAAAYEPKQESPVEGAKALFEKTAPPAAGSDSEHEDIEVDSWPKAVAMVQKRENCSR